MTANFVTALAKATLTGPSAGKPAKAARAIDFEMMGFPYYYSGSGWVVDFGEYFALFPTKENAEEVLNSLDKDRTFEPFKPDDTAPADVYYTVAWTAPGYGIDAPDKVSDPIKYAEYEAKNRANLEPSNKPEVFSGGHTLIQFNNKTKEYIAVKSAAAAMCGVSGGAITAGRVKVQSLYGSKDFFMRDSLSEVLKLVYVENLGTSVSKMDPNYTLVTVQGGVVFTSTYVDANADQFGVSCVSGEKFFIRDKETLFDGRVISKMDFERFGFVCTVSQEKHLIRENPLGARTKVCDKHYTPSFNEMRRKREQDPQDFHGHYVAKQGLKEGKIPAKSKGLFMACEIEVIASTTTTGAKAMAAIEKNRIGISVYDGSLPELGFEVKTCPQEGRLSAETIHQLAGIFDTNKIKADRTCGVHIHVSRAAITELQIDRVESFVYKFGNRAFMEAIAGRPSNSEYCKYNVSKGRASYIENKRKINGDRRLAINSQPKHTLEFRLFAGTTSEQSLLVYTEFVAAILEFTKAGVYPLAYTEAASYRDFLAFLFDIKSNRRKEYRNLIGFLVEKGIATVSVKKKA